MQASQIISGGKIDTKRGQAQGHCRLPSWIALKGQDDRCRPSCAAYSGTGNGHRLGYPATTCECPGPSWQVLKHCRNHRHRLRVGRLISRFQIGLGWLGSRRIMDGCRRRCEINHDLLSITWFGSVRRTNACCVKNAVTRVMIAMHEEIVPMRPCDRPVWRTDDRVDQL